MSSRCLHLYEVHEIVSSCSNNSARADVQKTIKYLSRFSSEPLKVAAHLPIEDVERISLVTLLPEDGAELGALVPSLKAKFSEQDLEKFVRVLYEHNPHLCS